MIKPLRHALEDSGESITLSWTSSVKGQSTCHTTADGKVRKRIGVGPGPWSTLEEQLCCISESSREHTTPLGELLLA